MGDSDTIKELWGLFVKNFGMSKDDALKYFASKGINEPAALQKIQEFMITPDTNDNIFTRLVEEAQSRIDPSRESYIVHGASPDGNCLYHGISAQLSTNPGATSLRDMAMAKISSAPERTYDLNNLEKPDDADNCNDSKED